MTITPDGFRYRSQIFPTVNGLFRWFKDHYQEPVPGIDGYSWKSLLKFVFYYRLTFFCSTKGITPSNSSRTRTPASLNATPANINIAGESDLFAHTHSAVDVHHSAVLKLIPLRCSQTWLELSMPSHATWLPRCSTPSPQSQVKARTPTPPLHSGAPASMAMVAAQEEVEGARLLIT